MEHLLEVKNLSVSIDGPSGEVQAVRDVSFSLKKGEVLAIVGESGCGKSVLCKSIMKLLPPSAKIKEGSISVNGQDITCYREKEMQKLRGKIFSMIFQDPMTALNPVMRVGAQIAEGITLHEHLSKKDAEEKAKKMLEMVGIPGSRYRDYPHQFSGGMKQRVVIAMALACSPDLLLADEPTSALDVTTQAQIVRQMMELRDDFGTGIIIVTHNIGVAAYMADQLVVMQNGKVVDQGTRDEVMEHPTSDYTKKLLAAVPEMEGQRYV